MGTVYTDQIANEDGTKVKRVEDLMDSNTDLRVDTATGSNQTLAEAVDSREALATSVDQIKALPTSAGTVYLSAPGRSGHFRWTTGNFSSQVSQDTDNAIYIKANSTSASSGAWVRSDSFPAKPGWAGLNSDTSNAGPGLNRLINLTNRVDLGMEALGTTTTVNLNNSNLAGETETGPQSRILRGSDARQSILYGKSGLNGPVLSLRYGTGAAAHSMNHIEEFSLLGNGPANDGLSIINGAFVRASNITARGLNTGLYLESTLSSYFNALRLDSNRYGVSAVKGGGFSYPNALDFSSCVFSNNTQMGYSGGSAHHNVTFNGGSFEGNGTQGDNNTGGVFLNFDGGVEGAVGATFRNVYFEGNGGAADIRLENIGSTYVTVIIEGCNFNRLSAAKYVQNHIAAYGKINLVLIGNAFRKFNNYSDSTSRPYLNVNGDVRVFEMGNYLENPTVAGNFGNRSNSGVLRGNIAESGTAFNLPTGWTSRKVSAGLYEIRHNLPVDPSNVTVTATSNSTGLVSVQRVVKGSGGFQVAMVNAQGQLTDSAFGFMMSYD